MNHLRLAGKIALSFIQSKLTPLAIVGSLLLGALAVMKTPREEEPQIVVPMLDVMVQMPGATPQEVEQRVSVPMEKLLSELPGVEYLYSISHPGMSVVIVRFHVGTKEEDAIVKTYNKLYSNFDKIPPGVSQPIVKVRSIDNVPILALEGGLRQREFGLGRGKFVIGGGHSCLRLVHGGLGLDIIDSDQHLPLADEIPFMRVHRGDVAHDLRGERSRAPGTYGTHSGESVRNGLFLDCGELHIADDFRRACGNFAIAVARGERGKREKQE